MEEFYSQSSFRTYHSLLDLRTVVTACVFLWILPHGETSMGASVQILPVGCYTNATKTNIFKVMTIYDPELPKCILSCIHQGMQFAAVFNRELCYCGNNLQTENNPYKTEAANCNMYCDRENQHPCGGRQTLSAYRAECSPGLYGREVTCRLNCGKCKNTAPNGVPICDVNSGNCDQQGCQVGFQGSRCRDECPIGKFGDSCLRDCFCPANERCHPETGNCTEHCAAGYKKDASGSCSQPCLEGVFGPDCSYTCHCSDDAVCNRINGSCPGKCAEGWTGLNCSQTCGPRKFGKNCELECHCKDGGDCNKITGICDILDCEAGWHGESCHLECPPTHFGPKKKKVPTATLR